MATRRRPRAKDDARGPWVQVAVFCDQVIIDKTETLTLVRIIDQVTITESRGSEGKMPLLQWIGSIVIALKAGDVTSEGTLTLDMIHPSGRRAAVGKVPMSFDDEVRGVNLAQRVRLRFTEEGLHWVNVRYEGRLLTRMPLNVRYQPAPAPEQDRPTLSSPP